MKYRKNEKKQFFFLERRATRSRINRDFGAMRNVEKAA